MVKIRSVTAGIFLIWVMFAWKSVNVKVGICSRCSQETYLYSLVRIRSVTAEIFLVFIHFAKCCISANYSFSSQCSFSAKSSFGTEWSLSSKCSLSAKRNVSSKPFFVLFSVQSSHLMQNICFCQLLFWFKSHDMNFSNINFIRNHSNSN